MTHYPSVCGSNLIDYFGRTKHRSLAVAEQPRPGIDYSVAVPAQNIFWALILTALLIVFWKDIKEAAENISDRFGGPPDPMAPLPSTDAHLLLKRSHKDSASL